jgi:hydroxypyruvate reductase
MSRAAGLAERIWRAGVAAVEGEAATAAALGDVALPGRIAAVGKAAVPMLRAALARFGPGIPALAVTKHGHAAGAPAGAEVIEAAHPVPDAGSLAAGRRLHGFVAGALPDDHLLLLVSGGASALAEWPEEGLTLDEVVAENRRLLAAGLDIHAMNARRKQLSRIKGGRLLASFPGRAATVLAISDVRGDSLAVIGSGIGQCPAGARFACSERIAASNAIARAAAAAEARALGLDLLTQEESLYGDVSEAAARIGRALKPGRPGAHVWGGEPTVVLPEMPGRGGRNQDLALRTAREIAGMGDLALLVAGTDGTDGPTDAAGGRVDGALWGPGAADALARADSGSFLDAHGRLFTTGPTGTNVMDLAVAVQL